VRSAPRTAEISPAGIRVIDGVEIDGVTPAMVWEVMDPIFLVGTKVAVFLGQVLARLRSVEPELFTQLLEP
jgi:hypothetical protein